MKAYKEAAKGGHTLAQHNLGLPRTRMASMLLRCATGDCLHPGGTGTPRELSLIASRKACSNTGTRAPLRDPADLLSF